jgi:hypothetical protein
VLAAVCSAEQALPAASIAISSNCVPGALYNLVKAAASAAGCSTYVQQQLTLLLLLLLLLLRLLLQTYGTLLGRSASTACMPPTTTAHM